MTIHRTRAATFALPGMVGPCQTCGTTIVAEKIVLSWRLGRWWQLCDACSEVVTAMDELHGLSEDV